MLSLSVLDCGLTCGRITNMSSIDHDRMAQARYRQAFGGATKAPTPGCTNGGRSMHNWERIAVMAASGMAALVLATPAFAQKADMQVNLTATVEAGCTLTADVGAGPQTTVNMPLWEIDPMEESTTARLPFTLTCDGGPRDGVIISIDWPGRSGGGGPYLVSDEGNRIEFTTQTGITATPKGQATGGYVRFWTRATSIPRPGGQYHGVFYVTAEF